MWHRPLQRLVKRASIYNKIQSSVGSQRVWNGFIAHCRPFMENWNPSHLWLDVGCGTAEVLQYLPAHIAYLGIDENNRYIQFARERYQHRPNTHFHCKDWNAVDWSGIGIETEQSVQVVSLLGLLHHLPTPEAKSIVQQSLSTLHKNGTLITLDGCIEQDAGVIERFFYWIDRGDHIRSPQELSALFPERPTMRIEQHWLRVPYRYALCTVPKS